MSLRRGRSRCRPGRDGERRPAPATSVLPATSTARGGARRSAEVSGERRRCRACRAACRCDGLRCRACWCDTGDLRSERSRALGSHLCCRPRVITARRPRPARVRGQGTIHPVGCGASGTLGASGLSPCITCFSRTTRITDFKHEIRNYRGRPVLEWQGALVRRRPGRRTSTRSPGGQLTRYSVPSRPIVRRSVPPSARA